MNRARIVRVACVVLVSGAAIAGCSSGSSTSSTTTTTGGGVTTSTAANGTPVAISVADTKGTDGPMTLTAVPTSVAAGPVTFTGTNTGTITHEVIVLKTDAAPETLAVTGGKVSEADSVGEISEFDAGSTSSVTLDLKAGSYILVCNVKDHYKLGMWTKFTVTG